MTKNYSEIMKKQNYKLLIFISILLILFLTSKTYAQCAVPPVGCANTNLANYGSNSNSNAATLEYDNFVSSFHSTVARTGDGTMQLWGERMANDGTTHVYSPMLINATNFPALGTATPLKMYVASTGTANAGQGILLATDGLYAWATEGTVLDNTITSSSTFQKVTIDGNTNGLPVGLTPGDVKMMFVTYQTIAITTCSGDVWVISLNASVRGNGNTGLTTRWYRVTTSAAGNPFLTNVVATRGSAGGLMALCADGSIYVWGNNIFLGDNTAMIATQDRAVAMTLPAGITPKMIGSGNNAANNRSYYVLATDGNLYALGKNNVRQLGDWTTTDRLSWVQPRYTSAAGPLMNDVIWISPQEHDRAYNGCNIINLDKTLYSFGENNNSMLSTPTSPVNPFIPSGINASDDILAVETGGHTTMVIKQCETDYGYVGHRINGSIGNGNTGTGTENAFTFNTSPIVICGAGTPEIAVSVIATGPNSQYCIGSSALLSPTPAGGTLSLVSGPGTIAGNTLTFTGLGNVIIQYAIADPCGGADIITTTTLGTEYCDADLLINKNVNNATPNVGSNVTFTLTALNNGPNNAYNVTVNDLLPTGYTYVSSIPSIGTFDNTSGIWNIGTINNGNSATLSVVATIKNSGDFTNTATIAAVGPDPDTTNNTATAATNPKVSATCSTNVLVNPSFEAPVEPVLNGNNIHNSPYSGWATQGNAQLNIIKVNGTGYANGPDNSHGTGNQYLDIANATDYPTQTFVVNAATTFSFSAWFSNRDSGSMGYLPWTARVDILDASDNVVASSSTQDFISSTPSETWFYVSGVANFLPAGTYKFRGYVGNFGHMDDAFLCISPGIDAVNDNFTSTPFTNLGGTTPSVFSNDTIAEVNGSVTTSTATITLITPPSGFTVNPNGTINVSAGMASGTYVLAYQICEVVPNATDCDTATVTIVVLSPIDAVVDVYPTQTPSTTVPTVVGDVTTNDTLNGVPVTTTNTDVTPVTTGPLSVDGNGILTLQPNTPSGTYTITYTICETGANPANCDTVTDTVVVLSPIDAVVDVYPTQTPSTTVPTVVGDVTTNDTLNGVPVTTTNTDVTPVTTGPLSVDGNGILTLQPNTPSGTYTITYTICETGANPANCDTVTDTVVVLSPIDAVVDVYPTQTPSTTVPTVVGDVTTNDTLNGVPVTTANTDVTPVTTGPLSVDGNGILTLQPNTPSGTYTITYTICETGANPANCDTVTDTVVVLSPIDAVVDVYPTQTPSTTVPTVVGDVTTNDTLNGVPVTTANTDVTPVTTGPLSVDGNGILTLQPNTPSGTYTITYTICETGANPANCDTVTDTVVVLSPIDAVVDVYPTQTPSTTVPTVVGDVTTNDTLNGVPVTTTNTDVTPVTTGPLSVDGNGILTLQPNTPSGTYTITYTICETGANPANCDTVTDTVVVLSPIDAVVDVYPTQTPSTTVPTVVGDVTTNDTLNGVPVTTTNTDVTPVTTGPLSVDGNGILTLQPNTPSGTYTITYTICETGANPANCDTVTDTVVVLSPIDAVVDVYPTQTPSTTVPTVVGDVTTNDTLNGVPVTTTNTDVTPVTTGPLSVDGNGILTLQPNTPSGTYTITYTICETGANPANCDTVTDTVVVLSPIDAVVDVYPTQTPSTTVPTVVGDVTTNDTLNGVPVTTANTDVTPVTTGPLSVDGNGILTLQPNTPSGTYTITYTICETGANPANCDTVTDTVVVLSPIDAVVDVYPTQTPSTTVPTVVGDVTTNDTLNGVPVTTTNTDVTPVTTGPLSVDGNGILTLQPNTPSGTYTITYTICETGANPANCDTVTDTVVVLSPIDAVVDVYPTQTPSTTVPTVVGDVTTNDTLNGVPVTTANTDVTPVTTGPLSVDGNGILTLQPNTPSGTYTITYTICETGANPANCDTVTDTVVVLSPIDAVVDVYPTQTPSTTVPTVVGDVTTNDTLNGVPVTTANTDVTPVTTGPLSVDGNGILTLQPNTPSGTYTITYTICETGANPANCDTVTDTVVVLSPIDAVVDVYPTQTPSTTVPTVVGDVTTNDTLNGVPVTTTNTDVTPVTTGPLSVDGNGILTLQPNTPSGTYTITYTICETGANPANCDTVTDTVVVLSPIDAVVDVYPTQTPSTTVPTVVGDVTTNDTLNGVPVTTTNTDVTPVTTGPLSVDGNGILTLQPNTPSGTYTITYTICETGANPANCDTVTDTVVVLSPIDAVVDVYPTQTPSTTVPTVVGDVTTNDTLNGVPVTTANTDVTPVTTGPLSVDGNGILTLQPNTPSGTYTITYTICETGANPANCDTVTDTVVVLSPIDAVVDVYPTQTPSTTVPTVVGDVTTNDTLNGVPVTTANTDVTPVTTGPLSVDGNGILTLQPNTPSGTYTITYTICETGANPANCDTVTDTVVVLSPIDAVVDVYPTQTPSTTVPTVVGDVTTNDTLNGVPVTTANTDVTPVTTGPLSVDGNGILTLQPNTPSGTYTITYTICETGANPANCDTVTDTVVVLSPIDAVVDVYPTQTPSTTVPTVVGDVTTNDTLNGVPVTTTNTDVTPVTTGPLSVDGNGILTLQPNTPSGTYTITYTICETGANPANCDTVTDTVVVLSPIDAVVDVYPTQTPSTTVPTVVGDVTTNDTLNGVPVTTANTDVTPVTTGPLSVDGNGILTLQPNTPSGTYTITYTICETGANPANCDTVTDTVVVLSPIDAVVDVYPTQTPSTTVPTVVGDVTTNDTLNGVPVTTANTDVTPVTTGPLSVDGNGILTLQPNTPSGTYTITYTICETGANPANCDTVTDTVVVLSPIDAVVDVYPTQTPSTTVPTVVGDVTTNDTLNGVPVTTTNTDVTPVTTGPLSVDGNGILTLQPNTPSGTYTITYTICETGANPANCDTVTDTVVVLSPIDAVVDVYPTQTPSTTVPTVVGDVTTNDTLNGVPVTTTNTDVTPVTTGPLSVDGNGILTLQPNTPSGTYTITYTICETGANPANCDTVTDTVVVLSPIDAVVDVYPTQTPSTTVPTVVGDVTTNDTLNGVPVTTANTDVTPVTTGPLSVDGNGILTLQPNTPSGTYTITYTICETGANPANCDTVTDTVVVLSPIDAVVDVYPTQTPSTTVPTVVGDVTTNDTLNGVPVTTANTDVTPVTTGPLSVDGNGILTLQPNTPSGTYTITYTICETGANPANCDTVTDTVVVLSPIDAVVDVYPTQTPSTTVPTVVGDVTTNDTLNGVPVTTANTDVTPVTTGPLSVDGNGILTLQPNTPSGTYTITYTICETGANPANCDTVTDTVVVLSPIDAVVDVYPTQTPSTTVPTVVGDVTTNDTLNGVPVTTANTDVTPVTTGPLSVDGNGILTLQPNTPSGTYTITYTICETGANPANCDTVTDTVVVLSPIDAVVDVYPTQTPSTTVPTVVGDVTTNDTLNGVPVTTTNTDVTPVTTGPLSVDGNGILTLQPNTPSGTYTITYTICETGANPANCDTVTDTVVVLSPIDAVVDVYPTQTPSTTVPTVVGDVTTNDTLNGVPVTTTNTDVTPVTTGPLSVDGNGILTLQPNTPSGTYTITYTICETGANPANCDTVTDTVVVLSPIDAVVDVYPTQTPSTTVPTVVGDVTTNDTLNGVPVTTANTDVTPVTTGPLSVDGNGILTLQPNTPSGTYTITYTICETGANPANCDTVTDTVVVLSPIIANDDNNPLGINGYDGGSAIASVITNDTLNGVLVNLAQVSITLTSTLPTGVTFDTTSGEVGVNPLTPAGTYTFTYQICENGAIPTNCDSATVTILVLAPPIVAQDDDLTNNPINGYEGGIAGNILLDNLNGEDTLNGLPVLAVEVNITLNNDGGINGLTIDNDGTITVPAGTSAGTYTIVYTVCDALNPTNCDTANVTIIVTSPVIEAVNNDFSDQPINSEIGGVLIIFDNDSLNGNPLTASEVTFTIDNNGGISGATIDSQGNLIVPIGTPIGTYTVTYTICEVTNPNNCDTATVLLKVKDPCDFDDSPASCNIIVHNYISANEDQTNDYFNLEGIERFPNNSIEIYNRWGILVFETKGYDNTTRVFRGRSEGRVTVKQDSNLPEGTYFYFLKYTKSNGDMKEKSGFLYINK